MSHHTNKGVSPHTLFYLLWSFLLYLYEKYYVEKKYLTTFFIVTELWNLYWFSFELATGITFLFTTKILPSLTPFKWEESFKILRLWFVTEYLGLPMLIWKLDFGLSLSFLFFFFDESGTFTKIQNENINCLKVGSLLAEYGIKWCLFVIWVLFKFI